MASRPGWPQCGASKGQAQSPKEEGASHFVHCPKQPLQSTVKILSVFNLFMNKNITSLSTIVWVFIHVRPELPSRVRRLGQKVLPCKQYGERWPL
jgi:hypothetical protein